MKSDWFCGLCWWCKHNVKQIWYIKFRGQHCTTEGHYFSMLIEASSRYLFSFVISRNKCNKFMSSSVTQQHRIRIDLSKTAVEPNNRCKRMVWRSVCHVPREHDAALTKPGNIVYCCTSRDATTHRQTDRERLNSTHVTLVLGNHQEDYKTSTNIQHLLPLYILIWLC